MADFVPSTDGGLQGWLVNLKTTTPNRVTELAITPARLTKILAWCDALIAAMQAAEQKKNDWLAASKAKQTQMNTSLGGLRAEIAKWKTEDGMTDARLGYANGYKPKTLTSRVGPITFRVPQVRGETVFYPSVLEKGMRSEQALKLAMAEMYVQGVSTRKVSAIVEELCGTTVSSTQVSDCAKLLELKKWRERPLGQFTYLIIDARYEKVRQNGQLLDCAVLLAMGVAPDGKRALLGVSVALSEAEVHWRAFFQSLVQRGLCGIQLIVSDNHLGLKAARAALFPRIPWQRCQFHLQQNAQAYVPRLDQRAEVARTIRSIFDCHRRTAAESRLKEVVANYGKTAQKLAAWMEENLPDGFAVFALPVEHQKKLRTSNAMERVNQEIKRRTRVARLFPNDASILRLVTAWLAEISDDWESGKLYLNMKTTTQPSV